jgi:hypothetical protein
MLFNRSVLQRSAEPTATMWTVSLVGQSREQTQWLLAFWAILLKWDVMHGTHGYHVKRPEQWLIDDLAIPLPFFVTQRAPTMMERD